MKIIVNGQYQEVKSKTISYKQLVKLSGMDPNEDYTISYMMPDNMANNKKLTMKSDSPAVEVYEGIAFTFM